MTYVFFDVNVINAIGKCLEEENRINKLVMQMAGVKVDAKRRAASFISSAARRRISPLTGEQGYRTSHANRFTCRAPVFRSSSQEPQRCCSTIRCKPR